MHHRQDTFAVFVQRDLARAFELPSETPREMLTLIDQICKLDQPIRS